MAGKEIKLPDDAYVRAFVVEDGELSDHFLKKHIKGYLEGVEKLK